VFTGRASRALTLDRELEMTSKPGKLLSLLLCLLLAAPANAGLAAWMALSMTDGKSESLQAHDHGSGQMSQHIHHEMPRDPSHQHHSSSHASQAHAAHASSAAASHESHDEADCNEHCVSCANHCSNLGIQSDNVMLSGMPRQLLRFESGELRSLPDLPYRPPIHA
jgi:hypothetical protein